MNIRIRVAAAADAPALFELNALFDNDTTLELLQRSLTENEREVVCIAELDGVAMGFCTALIMRSMCYAEPRADIEALYVKLEARRRGVAAALLRHTEEIFAAQGVRHFHVNTSSANVAALALYKRLGYAEAGELLLDKSV